MIGTNAADSMIFVPSDGSEAAVCSVEAVVTGSPGSWYPVDGLASVYTWNSLSGDHQLQEGKVSSSSGS